MSPLDLIITLELDRPRHLKLDYNALCRVEKAAGLSVFNQRIWNQITATLLRTILWAGLVWEDPSLTEDAVGDLITAGSFPQIMAGIGDLSKAVFSDPEVKDPLPPAQ